MEILKSGTLDEVQGVYSRVATQLRQDAYLWTPLMIAAGSNPHPEVIPYLIQRGQDVHARSLDGWTALMFAAAFNPEPGVVRALVEAGARISDRTANNWNFLYGASRYLNENITQSLVLPDGNGVSSTLSSALGGVTLGSLDGKPSGDASVEFSAHSGLPDWELCELLPWSQDWTWMNFAGNVDRWVDWLSFDHDSLDRKTGWSGIFFAARFNSNLSVFEILADLGDTPFQSDEGGMTPLDYAREFNPGLGELLNGEY